jgi:hypothetical protein
MSELSEAIFAALHYFPRWTDADRKIAADALNRMGTPTEFGIEEKTGAFAGFPWFNYENENGGRECIWFTSARVNFTEGIAPEGALLGTSQQAKKVRDMYIPLSNCGSGGPQNPRRAPEVAVCVRCGVKSCDGGAGCEG